MGTYLNLFNAPIKSNKLTEINLISNSPNTFIYGVEVLDNDKKLFFYEWHVQKGNDKDCNNCWFTTAVSQPFDQGNTI